MSKAKVKLQKDCEYGNHIFIVSNWKFNSTSQKASAWTCQKCLHTVEGFHDVDRLKEDIQAQTNT